MDFTSSNLSIENEYPKLVRDRIPEILAAKGLTAQTRVLTNDEFLKYLLKKMVEESTELLHSLDEGNTEEEPADILELVGAILKLKGWKMQDIVEIQKEKRQQNGGFEKKILLLEKP